jgi:hypothetical protein
MVEVEPTATGVRCGIDGCLDRLRIKVGAVSNSAIVAGIEQTRGQTGN